MIKTAASALALIAAVAGSNAVAADEDRKAYVGAGLAVANIAPDGLDAANIGALQARIGYLFSPYLAVEAEGAFGVVPQEYEITGTGGGAIDAFEVNLDYSAGVFVVGRAPLADTFAVFARGGYAQSSLTVTASQVFGGGDLTSDSSGAAFGGGLEFDFNDRIGLRGDYTIYLVEDNTTGVDDVSVGGLSIVGRF